MERSCNRRGGRLQRVHETVCEALVPLPLLVVGFRRFANSRFAAPGRGCPRRPAFARKTASGTAPFAGRRSRLQECPTRPTAISRRHLCRRHPTVVRPGHCPLDEEKTQAFLLKRPAGRQRRFVERQRAPSIRKVGGRGGVCNTTMALMALHGLGASRNATRCPIFNQSAREEITRPCPPTVRVSSRWRFGSAARRCRATATTRRATGDDDSGRGRVPQRSHRRHVSRGPLRPAPLGPEKHHEADASLSPNAARSEAGRQLDAQPAGPRSAAAAVSARIRMLQHLRQRWPGARRRFSGRPTGR